MLWTETGNKKCHPECPRIGGNQPAMGGFWTAAKTTRTQKTFFVFTLVVCTTTSMAAAQDEAQQFLDELGLPAPNLVKANISQEEYTAKMSLYLTALRDAPHQPQDIPQLLTYNSENKSWRRRRDESIRLHFHVKPTPDVEVQSAEVRLLFPAHPRRNTTHVRVYQVLGARRRRLLTKKTVYLSHTQPKWSDFDVTSAAEDWLSGATRNLGLFLECDHCKIEALRPLHASLNILAKPILPGRVKRSYSDTDKDGNTDCDVVNPESSGTERKPKCCRHQMTVKFEKLNWNSIVQPKEYEAGYCKGRCPHNFNYATNHSRIQNMVHRLDKRSTPRTCCAPSKLKPLEMLMVDPNDASKLTVHRWDNMIVVECACS